MSTHPRLSAFAPKWSTKSGDKTFWGRLYGSSKALSINKLAAESDFPVIVITVDSLSASNLLGELHFYADTQLNLPKLVFPDWETLPYDRFSPYQDIISDRLKTLVDIVSLKKGIIIVPITTIMHRLLPKEFLLKHSFILKTGDRIELKKFRKNLCESGYTFVNQTSQHGDVSIRGSIIDIYPMGASLPYRIDLFDEYIDSLRTFDPENQRSIEKIDTVRILPAREVPLIDENIARFRSSWRTYFGGDPNKCSVYKDVSRGIAPAGIEYYLSLFYENTDNLFDYFSDHCTTIFDADIESAAQSFWEYAYERYEQNKYDTEKPILKTKEIFIDPETLMERIKLLPHIYINNDVTKNNVFNYATVLPSSLTVSARLKQPLFMLKHFLSEFQGRVLIVAESAGRKEILLELLQENNILPTQFSDWSSFINDTAKIGLTVFPLEQGAQFEQPKVAVISEAQLLGARAIQQRTRRRRKRDSDALIRNMAEMEIGAPVAHEEHGVGRYRGLINLKIGSIPAEFIYIEYAEGDKLYIPVSSLNLISRYTGVSPEHAPLHRLGSGQWEKAKRKAAQRVCDVAAELLEINAQRAAKPGYAFTLDETQYRAFVQEFPFEETPDQMDAIIAVLDDMSKPKPMDRLVCGDSGFGKTEVAMRAIFLAVQNGKQTALLVPTTLLAQQHYQNFFRQIFKLASKNFDVIKISY